MPFVNIIFTDFDYFDLMGFDVGSGISKFNLLIILCGVTWLLFLFKNTFHYLALTAKARAASRLGALLRFRFLENILRQDLNFFFSVRASGLSVRLLSTIRDYAEKRTGAQYKISKNTLLVALYLGILFLISWKLTALSALVVPVAGAAGYRAKKYLSKNAFAHQRILENLAHDIQQKIYAIKMIKIFNSEKLELTKFERHNRSLEHSEYVKSRLDVFLMTSVEMAGVSLAVILLFMAGRENLNGQFVFGPGGLILFVAAVFSLLDPVKELMEVFQSKRELSVLEKEISAFDISTKPRIVCEKRITKSINKIEFMGVSFHYPEKATLLESVDLTISKGEKLILFGKSGSGKSTLVDLILGLQEPVTGKILIDGVPVHQIDPGQRSKMFGVITQETLLFHDTVRHNLGYDLEDIEDRELEEILDKAHLRDWLRLQPLGLDTVIGERGMKLSGGERQKFAIARMLLRDPEVIILDEATSSVDPRTEGLLMASIFDLFREKTLLAISHRRIAAPFMEKTLQIHEGRLMERTVGMVHASQSSTAY